MEHRGFISEISRSCLTRAQICSFSLENETFSQAGLLKKWEFYMELNLYFLFSVGVTHVSKIRVPAE